MLNREKCFSSSSFLQFALFYLNRNMSTYRPVTNLRKNLNSCPYSLAIWCLYYTVEDIFLVLARCLPWEQFGVQWTRTLRYVNGLNIMISGQPALPAEPQSLQWSLQDDTAPIHTAQSSLKMMRVMV